MAEEIRETTITPGTDNDLVQIRISDGQIADEFESFELALSVKIDRKLPFPRLAKMQIDALSVARASLSKKIQALEFALDEKG